MECFLLLRGPMMMRSFILFLISYTLAFTATASELKCGKEGSCPRARSCRLVMAAFSKPVAKKPVISVTDKISAEDHRRYKNIFEILETSQSPENRFHLPAVIRSTGVESLVSQGQKIVVVEAAYSTKENIKHIYDKLAMGGWAFIVDAKKENLESIVSELSSLRPADIEVRKDKDQWAIIVEKSETKSAHKISREQINRTEKETIQVIRKVFLSKADARRQVLTWLDSIEAGLTVKKKLTPLEHISISYILRSQFFDVFNDSRLQTRLENILTQSWRSYGQAEINSSQLLQPLPRSVLRQASRLENVFHDAIFHSQNQMVVGPFMGLRTRANFFKGYIPKLKDMILATGLLALSFSQTGGEVLAAFLTGYLIVTFAERYIHKHIGLSLIHI